MRFEKLKKLIKRDKGAIAQFIVFVTSAVIAGEIYLRYNLPLIPTVVLLAVEAFYINLSNWIYENWY